MCTLVEITKIFVTALAAVCVFVLGQVIQRLFIEPIQDQRKLVGRIAAARTFYANVGPTPTGLDEAMLKRAASPEETMKVLRGYASDLRASLYAIPWYSRIRWLFSLPPETNVKEASYVLVRLSNGVWDSSDSEQKHQDWKDLGSLLKIRDH